MFEPGDSGVSEMITDCGNVCGNVRVNDTRPNASLGHHNCIETVASNSENEMPVENRCHSLGILRTHNSERTTSVVS